MKSTTTLFTLTLLLAGSLVAAYAGPQEEVANAAKKLAKAGGYSWKATSEGGRFASGPITGKVAKDGLTQVSMPRRNGTTEFVCQGKKAAMKTDEGWRSLAELEGTEDNRGRFMSGMLRRFKAPAAEVEDLVKKSDALVMTGGAYSGKLTAEGVKEMLSFRPRADGEGPQVSNTSGSVKFWIKEGVLAKYQYSVKGTMNWNGNDREINRTTTVEINAIGSTQVEVPAEAKQKVS